jgi:biopolymer transport protein ExbD
MAKLFKKKRDQEEMAIDLTPMLDVVFIMLIFFIVTASFVSEQGFLVNRPPPAPEQDTPPPDSRNVVMVVSETDEIWFEGRRIDLRSVRANVERVLAENPQAQVIVRAHEYSTAAIYVGIADEAKEAVGSDPNFAVSLVTYNDS